MLKSQNLVLNSAANMLALYAICTAILVSGILNTIFTDEVLRKHYLSILYICTCFFFACCIMTLSEHCKFRRKTKCDSDLESEDEQETAQTASDLSWLKNFTVLGEIRPIYGMVVFTCAVFSIIYLFLFSAFDTAEDHRIGSDPWSAQMLLFISAFSALAVMFVVAIHVENELDSTDFSYEPFDENVEIPMNVYAPKMVAFLMAGQFNIFGYLFVQFVVVILLVIVCDLSEQDITEIIQGSKMDHTILICIATCINFGVLFFLIEKFAKAHEVTKNFLLGTFEKNWQRNLKAYEFLLPEIEVNSLEDLRLALLEKINDPELKDEEKKIIGYIKRPLWQTKRSFLDTPEEVYQAENRTPQRQNQSPNIAPEVPSPPRPQNPVLPSNGTPPSARISPPMTRSRAKRQ